MARCSYLFEYSETTPGPTQVVVFHRTTYSCIPRVADFLGVKNLQYVADIDDKIARAGYSRTAYNADGTTRAVTVAAGQRVYTAYGRANAKTVILKTGRNAAGKRRILTFTFPSFLNVAEIGDALAELLPPTVVAAGTTPATAQQVEPFYTIVGGNTYPLKTSAQAEATPFPNLAKTPAEEVTILQRTTSRRGFFSPPP